MGHLLGYARVSTGDQDAQLQHDALTKAGCYRIFTDTASGALESRPELDKLLDQIRPGDTLVVWRLDRLGRSIRHLINHMDALQQRDIEFKSLQENIDTSSSGGRLVFNIFASLAEFERDLIRERTNAGLAAARARGRTGGRPTSLSPDKLRTAKKLYEQRDMTVAQIGEVLGVSRSTLYRAISKIKIFPICDYSFTKANEFQQLFFPEISMFRASESSLGYTRKNFMADQNLETRGYRAYS